MAGRMNEIVTTFYLLVDKRFQFLINQFACKKEKRKPSGGVYNVLYLNITTGVEIGLEWREQRIYVEIFRLVNKKIKENPIIITPESELTVFNLEDLLAVRAPEQKLSDKYVDQPLSAQLIVHIVKHYAFALEEYAGDVLSGDFRVFGDIEALIKSRLAGQHEAGNNIREDYYHVAALKDPEVRSRTEALVTEMLEQGMTLEEAVLEFKKQFIISVLRRANGNLVKAAKNLNISRTSLYHNLMNISNVSPKRRA